MAALFGNATQRSAGKKNLVEFKAGKMYLQGKMCHADKRKGLVFVHQSEDSLMHFCWKDRTSGKVEEVTLNISILSIHIYSLESNRQQMHAVTVSVHIHSTFNMFVEAIL